MKDKTLKEELEKAKPMLEELTRSIDERLLIDAARSQMQQKKPQTADPTQKRKNMVSPLGQRVASYQQTSIQRSITPTNLEHRVNSRG